MWASVRPLPMAPTVSKATSNGDGKTPAEA